MRFTQWLVSKLFGVRNAAASLGGETTSEFTAEVVRITSVTAHPNADRLSIAKFELKGSGESAYEVVTGKDEFRVGDLAAYWSVDCLVPTAHKDFAFLLGRLDGAGKDYYRLKAARLRGVFSQGLLTRLTPPLAPLQFGSQLAAAYGVTYHRDPEPSSPNVSPGKSAKPNASLGPQYGVESLKKAPRLFKEGEPVCITEKLHGCNFRFGWVKRKFLGFTIGYRFMVGSHRTVKSPGDNDLWSNAAKSMGLAAKTKAYPGRIFYGELYGRTEGGAGIQDLTYGQTGPALAVFDVLDQKHNQWLAPFERLALLDEVSLPSVPVLCPFIRWSPELPGLYEGEKSAVDGATIKEGVVVESYNGPRRKAKFVFEQYLTRKGA